MGHPLIKMHSVIIEYVVQTLLIFAVIMFAVGVSTTIDVMEDTDYPGYLKD
jgi:hypothetical protein